MAEKLRGIAWLLTLLVGLVGGCNPPIEKQGFDASNADVGAEDAGLSDASSTQTCGDGEVTGDELCDGADLAGASCTSLGFDSGTLACADTCDQYIFDGCEAECARDCSGRECGPDPVCGISCGGCAGGTCSADGQCEQETCEPDCSDRECGPDPECGESCGTCDGTCGTDGVCHPDGPGTPQVVDFKANVSSLTEGENIRFTATVTDPDGVDDLIGGSLVEPTGSRAYGDFQASGSGGTFTIELTWSEIDRVEPIEFEQPLDRQFVAEFFDTEGNLASATLAIQLTCAAGQGACAGACTPLDTTSNCGSCGNECGVSGQVCDGGQCACPAGEEVCDGECVSLDTADNCGTCGNECPINGQICDGGQCACPDGESPCNGACEPDHYADCGGTCRSLRTTSNCGSCGNECQNAGERCINGSCSCPAGEELCNGECVDTSSSDEHCGACGNDCLWGSCNSGACECAFYPCGDTCTYDQLECLETFTEMACEVSWTEYETRNCNNVCDDLGMACNPDACGGNAGAVWDSTTCYGDPDTYLSSCTESLQDHAVYNNDGILCCCE